MSHAATNWAIRQRGLKPATKIVLWHLADCHNGHTGQCNPRQTILAEMCEMSRSTLNLHLDKLENLGLIRRVTTTDEKTKQQQPTHYILAFDAPEKAVSESRTEAEPGADIHQDIIKPCPKAGHGAVSEKQPEPCPDLDHSRVLNSDTYIRKNPGIEPGRTGNGAREKANIPSFDAFWGSWPLSKTGKEAARKAFTRLSPQDRLRATTEADAWCGSWRSINPQLSHIHPSTYLNNRRWEDEVQPQTTASSQPANVNDQRRRWASY